MSPRALPLSSLLVLAVSCTPATPSPAVTPAPSATAAPTPATPGAGPSPVSTDLEQIPTPAPQDAPLRGAFQLLDGRWEGTFRVYFDAVYTRPEE